MLSSLCKIDLNGVTTFREVIEKFFLYLYFVFQSTLKNISFTSS